jgi:hypothetical protein
MAPMSSRHPLGITDLKVLTDGIGFSRTIKKPRGDCYLEIPEGTWNRHDGPTQAILHNICRTMEIEYKIVSNRVGDVEWVCRD